MAEVKIAAVGAVGEVHADSMGRLLVGDTDLVKKFLAAWGGQRQLGRVEIVMHLMTTETTEASPSLSAHFLEPGE
jgi:hypothetical protein